MAGLFIRLFLSRKKRSKKQMKKIKKKNKHEQQLSYEQCREKRIEENMEKMRALGLFDLSSNFMSLVRKRQQCERKSSSHQSSTLPASVPLRRSNRLQNVNPVGSVEMNKNNKENGEDDSRSSLIKKGSRPEIYTEEHVKLLGSCKSSWTLFVDGYGKNGKRLNDSTNGKTCHQCRKKTLGHRTSCVKCKLVRGQFCGDCLYMRYGENVLEVNQNPEWICPVCRGICNCSVCRRAKGWLPTRLLYTKVSKLGFKSVAHYLIHTLRDDKIPGPKDSFNSDDGKKGSLEQTATL
ncbi:hypothetical protein AQUCO_06700051v1 [Aquilegia coerulea]|uniref:Zinc-finger domain-containing protein n=1 Tax=Aquilegia coerulea TaxID=218851 RepID=A0A2G5CBV3_AQUCA|nr:hypothetical protein AQUCO_06700051v1 [Aquilegia coerulea]